MKKVRFFLTALLILAPVLVCAPHAQASTDRKAIKKTLPVYPDLAQRMHLSGTVKIEVVVAPDGSVKQVTPLGGHPLLINSAVNAVKMWKFQPATQETTEEVEMNFNPGN